jgi:hypothetical protein
LKEHLQDTLWDRGFNLDLIDILDWDARKSKTGLALSCIAIDRCIMA